MERSNDPLSNHPLFRLSRQSLQHIDIHMPIIPIMPNIFLAGDIPDTFDNDDIPDKPADKQFVNSLQEITVDQEMYDKEIQCSICFDRFQIGDTCIKLPCENPHFFHTGDNKELCEGIKPWFQLNHNCPVCRHTFPEQNDDPLEGSTENNDPLEESTESTENQINSQGLEGLLMNRINQILYRDPIDHIFNPPIRMNNFIDQMIDREDDRRLQEAIRLSLENN